MVPTCLFAPLQHREQNALDPAHPELVLQTPGHFPSLGPGLAGSSHSPTTILTPPWSGAGIFLLLHELTNWPFPESG